ncbi:AAA family ATPase [Methylorubrum aminovorans]
MKAICDAFARARAKAPCILFIDEIYGISDRATIRGEYVQYWTQVVNCLLEHLAGVKDQPGVVVVAATNHPDRIDAAVRRAGCLDRGSRSGSPTRRRSPGSSATILARTRLLTHR